MLVSDLDSPENASGVALSVTQWSKQDDSKNYAPGSSGDAEPAYNYREQVFKAPITQHLALPHTPPGT